MDFDAYVGVFINKKIPIMRGNVQHRAVKATESTELIISTLVSKFIWSKLMKADIQIIEKDSFIITI